MRLFSSDIKKIIIFSKKKAFLIFLEMEPCPSSKNTKTHPEKIYYTLIL